MKQSPIMYDKAHTTHVCKLKKEIYELWQAPRAWYSTLSNFLFSFGSTNSIAYKSPFVYNSNGLIIYTLVYVDDIIFTINNSDFVKNYIESLSQRFSLRNLGNLNYFLAIEILEKYVLEIIEKTNIKGVNKPIYL